MPDTSPAAIRTLFERWNIRGELRRSLFEGLEKAGLDLS